MALMFNVLGQVAPFSENHIHLERKTTPTSENINVCLLLHSRGVTDSP